MKHLLENLDSLLPVIIFVIVVISSWLKKRQGGEETWPEQPSAPTPKRPASGTPPKSDWEEELRRLLEGQEPVVKPQPTSPPPVGTVPERKPPPLPASKSRTPSPPLVVSPAKPVPAPTARAASPRSVIGEQAEAPGRLLAHLVQSAQAHERASRLQEQVGARIAEVGKSHEHYYQGTCRECGGKIEFPLAAAGTSIDCPHCGEKTVLAIDRTTPHLRTPGIVGRPSGAKEAAPALALLRQPGSARQAIIVSCILGPPKALET